MTRPSRVETFLRVALIMSQRATCLRGQVGAVIVHDKRIVSTGYNGSPVGQPHCEQETCNDKGVCKNSIHAEANAIAFAARYGIPTNDCKIYSTHSPCRDCAELIIQAGIKEVHYIHGYSSDSGLELLVNSGIITRRHAVSL